MADRYEMVLDLVDNASSAIDSVKDKLLDLAQNATGTTKALGIAGLAVGAAAALSITALNNISEAAHAAVEKINEVGDASARLGIGVKELQTLTGTFKTFGVTAEQTYDALIDFTEKIEDARDGSGGLYESLQKLGIQLNNTDGSLKSNITLFDQWFKGVTNLGDASARVWHGAQVSDAMRDIVSQGESVAAVYDKIKERVEENVKVTQAHVLAARDARIEAEIYKQTQEQNKTVVDAVMAPTAKWWDQVSINTNKAWGSAKLYFQEFGQWAGFIEKGTASQQLVALEARLQQQREVLEQIKKTSNSDMEIAAFQSRVDATQRMIDELKKNNPDLVKALNGPVNTQTAPVGQNSDQIKAQQAYLDKLTKAQEDARVKAVEGFKAQTEAELALTNQRLEDEANDTIKKNKITGDAVTEIWAKVRATQASNSLAAQNKIADYQKKQDEQAATRSRAVQNVIDGIESQTKQLEAQTQTLTTNSRELEYQLEVTKALEQAKTANNNKDLDSVTINRIKSELLEKQAAARKLEAAQQDKNFKDTVTNIEDQTEALGAITQEQKNQVEIKQAIIDKEREYKRSLTETEKQTLTNALIDKQKAQATADLATKNAEEIKQIYANAAESIQGAFSDFFFDVMQGNLSNLADSFKKTIDRMVADLLAANLFKLVGGIGTGTAGEANLSGFFASIFGGISGRATGGPVTAGTPYWVGEEGPEIVIPSASSTVVPTDLSMAVASGQQGGNGGGQQITNVTIKALDAKSVVQLIEDNDRAIVTKLAEASQRYGM